MGHAYINENDIENSLNEFSKGNTFSLFKLALSNIYNQRELLNTPGFIVNLIKNLNPQDDVENYLNLILDNRCDLTVLYEETNQSNLKDFRNFWGEKISSPTPLIFAILPYLTDEQSSKLLKNNFMYRLSEMPSVVSEAPELLYSLLNKGHSKTLVSMKEECYFFDSQNLKLYDKQKFPGYEEEITLDELIFQYAIKNPELIEIHSKLTYSGLASLSDRWLTHHLDQDRKDNILIQKFIDTVFDKLDENGKELITAQMLYKTNDLDFLQICLNKMGVNKIEDYHPQKYPIWIKSADHKNKSIYRKLLRSGTDLFSLYPDSNRTFLSSIVDGFPRKPNLKEVLAEQKIEYKDFIKDLLEIKTDARGIQYNNFALCLATGDSSIIEHLNLNFEDLENYSKKFKVGRYEKLKTEEKLTLIEDILNKTFLAPTYCAEGVYYVKHIEKCAIGFNMFMANQYGNIQKNNLIHEHLTLLEKVDIQNPAHDYRKEYFKIAKYLLEPYPIRHININSEHYNTCIKIIDYVATDKTLNWQELYSTLKEERYQKDFENYSDGAKNIYNYLQKIALSYTLVPQNIYEKKKLKL